MPPSFIGLKSVLFALVASLALGAPFTAKDARAQSPFCAVPPKGAKVWYNDGVSIQVMGTAQDAFGNPLVLLRKNQDQGGQVSQSDLSVYNMALLEKMETSFFVNGQKAQVMAFGNILTPDNEKFFNESIQEVIRCDLAHPLKYGFQTNQRITDVATGNGQELFFDSIIQLSRQADETLTIDGKDYQTATVMSEIKLYRRGNRDMLKKTSFIYNIDLETGLYLRRRVIVEDANATSALPTATATKISLSGN
ncbi:MAG: hypothetical protein ACPGO3_12465 [Magnetospiraceae bacterium]